MQNVLPAYPYAQYSDDVDVQAFFGSLNALAQSYLLWFNGTPLSVYTSAGISGPLLDWVANGVYGIARPVLLTTTSSFTSGLDTFPLGFTPLDTPYTTTSGTATIANDDVYKRVLTWYLYRGDGFRISAPWLRKRVARFLYGTAGGDVTLTQVQTVGVLNQPMASPAAPALSQVAGGTIAATTYYAKATYVTSLGETMVGAESTLAVAADYLLSVASPSAVIGASGWNVYISTATGTETKQNTTVIPIGTAWTEPTTGLISGAGTPVSNTSVPAGDILIVLPAGGMSNTFQQCLANQVFALPFQKSFSVYIV